MATLSEASAFRRSARRPPGPRDWILDVYGSFVRDFGGWIAVADLLELLGSLGVGSASGRASVSRMKRRGELRAETRGTACGYSLAPETERWFVDGTERIMGRTLQSDDDMWAIASFSVPEEDRELRYKIRSRLVDLGYGQLNGGLMIAPSAIADETVRALELAWLVEYVDVWVSRYLGSRPLTEVVEHAWDLSAIDAAYREYLTVARGLEARGYTRDGEEAFVRYLVNMNSWRELPFMDPGIPAVHLPDNWLATQARSQFSELSSALGPAALRHFVEITGPRVSGSTV